MGRTESKTEIVTAAGTPTPWEAAMLATERKRWPAEDNRSLAEIALERAIRDMFALVPVEYKKDKKTGETKKIGESLDYVAPADPFKEPANPSEKPVYPHHAVQSIYEILLLVKRSDVFNCQDWNKRSDASKLLYVTTQLRTNTVTLRNRFHSLDVQEQSGYQWHSWTPRVVDDLTFEASKVLLQLVSSLLEIPDIAEREQLVDKHKLIKYRLRKYSPEYNAACIRNDISAVQSDIENLQNKNAPVPVEEVIKIKESLYSLQDQVTAAADSNVSLWNPLIAKVFTLYKAVKEIPIVTNDSLTLLQLKNKLTALNVRLEELQALQKRTEILIRPLEDKLVSSIHTVTNGLRNGMYLLQRALGTTEEKHSSAFEMNQKIHSDRAIEIAAQKNQIDQLQKYIATQTEKQEVLKKQIEGYCIQPLRDETLRLLVSDNPHAVKRIEAISTTIKDIEENTKKQLEQMTANNFQEKSAALKQNSVDKMLLLSQNPVFDMGTAESLKRAALKALAFFGLTWAKNKLAQRVTHCRTSLFNFGKTAQDKIKQNTSAPTISGPGVR